MTRNQWDWKTAGAALLVALFALLVMGGADILDSILPEIER